MISTGISSRDYEKLQKIVEKIDPKFKELILTKIPSNRLGEPSDVANVAAFLSSEMSNYITGETIHVNGGMYMS